VETGVKELMRPHLEKIAANIETIAEILGEKGAKEKGKVKKFFIRMAKIIWYIMIALIPVALAMFAFQIQRSTYELTRANQTLVLAEAPLLERAGEWEYKLNLNILQGGIARAYIVEEFVGNDAIYTPRPDLIQDGGTVTMNIAFSEAEIRQLPPIRGMVTEIGEIKQFSVVLLDTVNQWHVFYLVVRPSVSIRPISENAYLEQTLEIGYTKNGARETFEFSEHEAQSRISEKKAVIFNGSVINQATIKDIMEAFPAEAQVTVVETVDRDDSGMSVRHNISVDIQYTIPNPEEVYNRIQRIFNDIQR